MKKLVYILLVPAMLAAAAVVKAQDYAEASLGLPGDNLNLYAVMKLFQESETLEGFERNLNDENSRINNLDLNGDNYIDYIRVIDQPDGRVHLIVLQVAINSRENQDVAVFVVQREADNQVRIQLIGDEDLYGRGYIIEPNYDNGRLANETPNPGYAGERTVVVNRVSTVEVAAWPLVRFMFLPTYVVWHSPWYWDYYPNWWSPWRPHYWHYYYGYHHHWYPHYHSYYRHTNNYYYPRYQSYYYGSRRSYSPYVVTNINRGTYKTTYSRPETRRAGSDLYTKTYTGNRRTTAGTSGNTQVNRSSTRNTGSGTTTRRTTTNTTRSGETTTGRTSTKSTSSQPAVRTETKRPSSDSRVSTSSSRKSSSATTSRPSTKPATAKSSGSSSRKASGSSEVKSRSSESSSSGKSGERTRGTSSGRR
ncbi:MAG TPA: hypothetical protein VJ203_08410 [Bacteroidales bacterium]|nr:hypothetical protein [Bacteroidales bacterium]